MYRRVFVGITFLFFFMIATSAVAFDSAASNAIVGDWNIKFAVSGQTVSGTMSIRNDGGMLAGDLVTAHTGPGTLRDLKWTDGKLTTTCVFERHDSISLKGEVKGDGLAGTFHTEGMEGTWEATRSAGSTPAANH